MTCNTSAFGCCPDGVTPAHGVDMEGCCLQYPYGCCPDNYKPAEGPHLEGQQSGILPYLQILLVLEEELTLIKINGQINS